VATVLKLDAAINYALSTPSLSLHVLVVKISNLAELEDNSTICLV